jgi:adenylylsulfate kinase
MTPSPGWVLWFTGLPGCGKSSVARQVQRILCGRGIESVHLEMDAKRREYFPDPQYTEEEREAAYRLFAHDAARLAVQGENVLMDATAPRLAMRRRAAALVERFGEVHLACSLDTALARESSRPEGKVMAGLYEKALERRRTGREFEGLGPVPGVDVPFEKDPRAWLTVDAEETTPDEAARLVVSKLERDMDERP